MRKKIDLDKLKKDIDCVLLFNFEATSPNFRYLSGNDCSGIYILTKESDLMVVPKMEYPRVKGIRKISAKGSLLDEALKKIGKPERIGIDKSFLTLNQFGAIKKKLKGKKFVDISRNVERLRKIKSTYEIETLKRACSISENIIRKCINKMKTFTTESEVRSFLVSETIKNGCELSFQPVVASGKNSSVPHYDGNSKIKKGFMIIDFGVKYKGYCADITRTVFLGRPSKKDIENYEKVRYVQKRIIEDIRSRSKCSLADKSARSSLGKRFIHALGHGIGLEVHETPGIGPNSKNIFEEGMCFAIEPGIYVNGKFGIRIEDNLVIKNGKAEMLSSMKNELVIID